MCDCEMPSCSTQSTPRARKAHTCCECRGGILPGERYQLITGVWEGSGSSYKTCLQCAALRSPLKKLTGCCTAFHELYGELREACGQYKDGPALLARFEAIRIQRGAAICPLYQAEENDLSHLTDP